MKRLYKTPLLRIQELYEADIITESLTGSSDELLFRDGFN